MLGLLISEAQKRFLQAVNVGVYRYQLGIKRKVLGNCILRIKNLPSRRSGLISRKSLA